MNFWKKLFAGMGFVCGFLVFEAILLAYHNSSRRHKNRKGRCRRNSFWDTLTRYMIFAWIYDGVKKSREQVGRRYYRRTGNEFRPSYGSDTKSNPSESAKAAPKTADAAQPKKQRSPPSAPKTTAKTASASTADRLKVPAAEAKPPLETTVKPVSAAEKPLQGRCTGYRKPTCPRAKNTAGGGGRASTEACPVAHRAAGAGLRYPCRRAPAARQGAGKRGGRAATAHSAVPD